FVLLSACAPESSRTQPQAPIAAQPEQPRAPKTLTIGIQRQPDDFLGFAGSPVYGGVANVLPMVHDDLVALTDTGELLPMLAAEIPSLDKGTWTLNADGTMDTIWKLRPDVKWHDGAAFTSADLLFSFTVTKDAEIPRSLQGRRDL